MKLLTLHEMFLSIPITFYYLAAVVLNLNSWRCPVPFKLPARNNDVDGRDDLVNLLDDSTGVEWAGCKIIGLTFYGERCWL